MNSTLQGQVRVKKRDAKESNAPRADSAKMSPSEMLRLFDELWRIEHAEDLAKMRAKEQKAKALREAIASLDN